MLPCYDSDWRNLELSLLGGVSLLCPECSHAVYVTQDWDCYCCPECLFFALNALILNLRLEIAKQTSICDPTIHALSDGALLQGWFPA